TDADLERARWTGVDLGSASVHACQLRDAMFIGCSFAGTGVTGGVFEQTQLLDADLTTAILRRCTFVGADLSGCRMGGVDLRSCRFVAVRLAGCDLQRADLRGTSLDRCQFPGAALNGALLDGCHAPGAVFTEADLRG